MFLKNCYFVIRTLVKLTMRKLSKAAQPVFDSVKSAIEDPISIPRKLSNSQYSRIESPPDSPQSIPVSQPNSTDDEIERKERIRKKLNFGRPDQLFKNHQNVLLELKRVVSPNSPTTFPPVLPQGKQSFLTKFYI